MSFLTACPGHVNVWGHHYGHVSSLEGHRVCVHLAHEVPCILNRNLKISEIRHFFFSLNYISSVGGRYLLDVKVECGFEVPRD